MSRPRRHFPGGMVFHVLNRGVGGECFSPRTRTFWRSSGSLRKRCELAGCGCALTVLMPNHWHFVVWPERDGDLAAFMQQVTNTHVKRWKEHRHEIGYGHLYQGHYKCFPVETEDYFYQVVRYVERNALRVNLVERAESWRWSSLRRVEREDPAFPILSTWPLPSATDWLQIVNQPQTEAEVAALRCCVNRGRPFAILTGSRTRPSDWGWNRRFGPVEDRRNNHRLATVTGGSLLFFLLYSPNLVALSFSSGRSQDPKIPRSRTGIAVLTLPSATLRWPLYNDERGDGKG